MCDFMMNILDKVEKYRKKTALIVENKSYSYRYLISYAHHLAGYFSNYQSEDSICVILSKKTITFYAGMLACFFSNTIYTPLNVETGIEKSKLILSIIKPTLILVADITEDILLPFISENSGMTLLFTDNYLFEKYKHTNNKCIFIEPYFNTDIKSSCFNNFYIACKKQSIAYLFFTSGSTGSPKGVPISYNNLTAYLSSITQLFHFSSQDRFVQLSDIAFDISIHEILVALISGGCLYIYDDVKESNISNFMLNHKITQCMLVPSVLNAMIQQAKFYHIFFNALKCTLVCGEPFPITYASDWQVHAPNSMIVNLYGPTETTVCCTYHIYNSNNNYHTKMILPIGRALSGVLLDVSKNNELIISGAQVSKGYWNSNQKELSAFKFDVEQKTMSYYSGDLVSYDEEYGYHFLGRIDDQWQIKGYRIEKNDVENVLKSVLNIQHVYVTPVYENQMVAKLIGFSNHTIDIKKYFKALQNFLPTPVIPSKIVTLKEIPQLSNGKINYKKLAERAMEC